MSLQEMTGRISPVRVPATVYRTLAARCKRPTELTKLRAVVLLGATLRATTFTTAIKRSILDLPVDAERTLLDLWCEQADQLAVAAGVERLPVRLLHDADTPAPLSGGAGERVSMCVERDPGEYRGTGGVLRDLVAEYEDSDRVLVASAAQILVEPLGDVAVSLASADAMASLISHEDGTPSSAMLATVACLRLIPKVGFVDMKEQALPLIAKHHSVRACKRRSAAGYPIRGLSDYIGALRRHHAAGPGEAGAFAEDWRPMFSVVEAGAEVGSGARVHDSVVLRGGRVEPGAIVVRSVVTAGGVVRRGDVAVDRLVAPATRSKLRTCN